MTVWICCLALCADPTPPRMLDQRLTIELFAAEPAIVTPIGIAVDRRGRVLVVESHTHFPPEKYAGPKTDRIRLFEDRDNDGRAETVGNFHVGGIHTMGLGIHPSGDVYVCTRKEVFRLRDRDNDGTADERTTLVRLATKGDYPHNGLSGFAFDLSGNVYFGLGENLGAEYRLIGSDGTTLSGGGEGGNIYRCNAAGGNLIRLATGFWNPFHLAFDCFGNLFALDNDPDDRPPNRLLHIVEGGDYGYRFRYGRRGLHPFQCWNGELPGTLPMVAGTGEGASGLLVYESDQLPSEFRGAILVTSWGDHRLERYRLKERGASFSAEREAFAQGNENFRPVGIAQAPDGSLLVSDWVDKAYEVHGKGRIWRVRAKGDRTRLGKRTMPNNLADGLAHADRWVREESARGALGPSRKVEDALAEAMAKHPSDRGRAAALAVWHAERKSPGKVVPILVLHERSNHVRHLAAVLGYPVLVQYVDWKANERGAALLQAAMLRRDDSTNLSAPTCAAMVSHSLASADPFVQQAAVQFLSRNLSVALLEELFAWTDAPSRRAGMLLLHDLPTVAVNGKLDVRLRPQLVAALRDADASTRFLAIQTIGERRLTELRSDLTRVLERPDTDDRLFAAVLAAVGLLDGRSPLGSKDEQASDQFVAKLLADPRTSIALRVRAMALLPPEHAAFTPGWLREQRKVAREDIQRELARIVRYRKADAKLLLELIADERMPGSVRAEAVMGLSPDDPAQRDLLAKLAMGPDREVQVEAIRTLRRGVQPATRDLVSRLHSDDDSTIAPIPRNDDLDGWEKLLARPGDAAAGGRVFFHPLGPGCYKCHAMAGRGGKAGSDLFGIGKTLTRRRLIESILLPSREIAPAFTSWSLLLTDGRTLHGWFIDDQVDGGQIYADSKGERFVVKPGTLERRVPSKTSIMPEGLEKVLTVQEFRDLLAFLQSPAP